MRLFIAIDISAAVRDGLAALQTQLLRRHLPVTWAAPVGMHLTLRFLGETPAGQLVSINTAMQAAANRCGIFTLATAAPGAFPDMHEPAVLWIGVGGDIEQLLWLYTALGRALEPLGFAHDERPFRPHLTLGRVRDRSAHTEIAAAMRELFLPSITWQVDHIALYRSERMPQGPRYTRLSGVQLA
ncbi:MAG TPA: RNA 2',3'-cyclic phosphodiesterase [Roseiflexaceae bacterium]|nr:RNA 2',3'-cyclic phosphodiesterase [Roseiflexaceae bacterium]HMP40076.1 RNA 2',3'-cyclic phosphodiesterase [Roseiflexaceae bacterium]